MWCSRLVPSWKTAGLGCLAVYGPFVVMALYVLAFVSCSHCKAMSWTVLPIGPGLPLAYLLRHSTEGLLGSETAQFVLAGALALAMVLVPAVVGRFGRWWLFGSVALILCLNCFQALAVLALIRA